MSQSRCSYRFQRLFIASCIVVGTAAMLVAALANLPYYGSQPSVASAALVPHRSKESYQ